MIIFITHGMKTLFPAVVLDRDGESISKRNSGIFFHSTIYISEPDSEAQSQQTGYEYSNGGCAQMLKPLCIEVNTAKSGYSIQDPPIVVPP